MTRATSVRIVRRHPELDAQLFPLYEVAFGADKLRRYRARWPWQFEQNPNNDDRGPLIWVALDGDAVLGQMATMPLVMWWGDREVRASAGMDHFVIPERRGQGLGIALSEQWANHVDVALGLGLNAASHPMLRKIFTDVGPVPAYLKVLDASKVARRRWGRVVGAVAGPGVAAAARLTSARPVGSDTVEVREVTALTDEYDALWTRARSSFTTVVRRDRRYLTWKYLQCPFRSYRILEARMKGDLTGWAVTRPEDDASSFPRGIVIDLFSDTGDRATAEGLIDAAVQEFRARGYARAETYCMHRGLGAAFKRLGFRTGRTAVQYTLAHRHASAAPLSSQESWGLTLGDGDLDRA